MPEPIRVELAADLAGSTVLVDPDSLTFGLLEDMQSNNARVILDSLAACVVGGSLPHGTDRAGLRRLTIPQMQALIAGVLGAPALPKAS